MPHVTGTRTGRISIVLLCVAGLLGTLGAAAPQPGKGARVVLGKARMERLEQQRQVTGELQATRRALLASQEEGWVIDFPVREGDRVTAGMVVARLDDKLLRLEVQRMDAVLKKWKAQIDEYTADLTKRERDVVKLKDAYSKGSATDTEIADAETLVTTARARLDQANAELATGDAELGLARERLADAEIRSPLEGRVATRRTEVGQWLKRGDAVIELVQLNPIEAWLDVPEAVLPRLTPPAGKDSTNASPGEGVEVQIRLPALGEVRKGRVAAILPRADSLSRLVPVRVLLDNADELLRPGMSITGLVPAGNVEPSLTVPKDAVMRNDAGAYVYFNAGGIAAIARVEVLFGAGNRVAIHSDQLKPEMEVIVEGNERLFPGQALAPVPAAPSAAPPADQSAPKPPSEGK